MDPLCAFSLRTNIRISHEDQQCTKSSCTGVCGLSAKRWSREWNTARKYDVVDISNVGRRTSERGLKQPKSVFKPFHSQEWSISNFTCSLARNITPHSLWRTWLFIAYSEERWLYYRFSPPYLYISLKGDGRKYFLTARTLCLCSTNGGVGSH